MTDPTGTPTMKARLRGDLTTAMKARDALTTGTPPALRARVLTAVTIAISLPGVVGFPGGSMISVSSLLPHTGALLGKAHGAGLFHERTARMGITRGPSLHGCLYALKSTGR